MTVECSHHHEARDVRDEDGKKIFSTDRRIVVTGAPLTRGRRSASAANAPNKSSSESGTRHIQPPLSRSIKHRNQNVRE